MEHVSNSWILFAEIYSLNRLCGDREMTVLRQAAPQC